MNVNYLDPSAWVKRYFAETGSDTVAKIFQQTDPVACSRFGLVEVAATIARKGASESLDADVLDSLLTQAQEDFASFMHVQISDELLIYAETLAFSHGLRAGDAVHLASALALVGRHDVKSVTMVSADAELVVAAQEEFLLTINPNQVL